MNTTNYKGNKENHLENWPFLVALILSHMSMVHLEIHRPRRKKSQGKDLNLTITRNLHLKIPLLKERRSLEKNLNQLRSERSQKIEG